jgi:hypothetical protein
MLPLRIECALTLFGDDLLDPLQGCILPIPTLEMFFHGLQLFQQSFRNVLNLILKKARTQPALLRQVIPVFCGNDPRVPLIANGKGQMIINALNGTGTHQVIEGR